MATKKKPATKKPAKKRPTAKKKPATTDKKAATKKPTAKKKPAASKKKPVSVATPATKPTEAAAEPRSLHVAPFPRLEWTPKHSWCWYGTDRLESWAGLRFYSKWMKRSPKPDDGTVDIAVPTSATPPREPTPSQRLTYAYLKEHERALTTTVLERILASYPEAKSAYEESVDESWPALPVVDDIGGLAAVIGPPTIHILDNVKDPGAAAEIAFAFDCAWDEEHQLGVLTFGGEVIEVGDGSVAGHIRE
jgi:hypothetical protein